MIVAFGGRSPGASLVPGDEVPDALLQALKAMADPTRLRILRYLSVQPMTPTELSHRLRLRAPTVIHHLHSLRLAGLVHLTVESGGEKRYEARQEMVGATFENIREFLNEGS
jgi:DNA-binding transcriptional ArsR family regulator